MKKEELEDLKRRTLHLNCTKIVLANGEDATQTYSGPGYIRQNGSEGFDITLFVEGSLSLPEFFNRLNNAKPGVLIPKTYYWSMSAIDNENRKWSALRILDPSKDGAVNGAGYIVMAFCRELVMTRDEPMQRERFGVEMHIFTRLRFPRNSFSTTTVVVREEKLKEELRRNIAQFNSGSFEFMIAEENGDVLVRALSIADRIHPFLESRITESLLFSLGTKVNWSFVKELQNGSTVTRLRSPGNDSGTKNVKAPVNIDEVGEFVSVWKLFDLYFSHVLKDVNNPYHPLSSPVLAVIRSNDSSINAQSLSLVVAVENLLSEFFKSIGSLDSQTKLSVRNLTEYVEHWPGDDGIKKRAIGLVKSLKTIRAEDRLRSMLTTKAIDEPNMYAWKKLRNSVAHGDWGIAKDLQIFVDLIGKVRVLFYQLVFQIIGYTGQQTDWGMHGWPLIDYPPRIATATDGENTSAG